MLLGSVLWPALAACSNSNSSQAPSSETPDTVQFAASSADLPECTDRTEGELWYVWSTNTYFLCETAEADWTRTKRPEYQVALGARPLDSTSQCPDGGLTIEFGLDIDGDGSLNRDEMTGTADLCTPAQSGGSAGSAGSAGTSDSGSLLVLTREPPGRQCADGGVKVETGIDLDQDKTLSADEVTRTEYVCDGDVLSETAGAGGAGSDEGEAGSREQAGTSGRGSDELGMGGTTPSPDCESTPATLSCAAGNKLIGTAVDVQALANDARYAETLFHEFSSVTAENAMKWGSLQPVQGQWNFDAADALIAAAEAHGQSLYGHTLVWHQQMPRWASALTGSALIESVREHITTTVEHFAGRVRAWDVVNEAIADGAKGALLLRPGIHSALGISGLADAFKWAAAADPDAILAYNDFGIEGIAPKSDSVYALIQALLAEGAPVHALGMQAHLSTAAYPSEQSLRANIERFEALGLEVNVTELDVTTDGLYAADLAARATHQQVAYQVLGGVCATEAACHGLTTWGFTDAYSWRSEEAALPFDASFERKPAYDGLFAGLAGTLPTASAELGNNLDCENGTTNWTTMSGSGLLGNSSTARSGATSCVASERTQTYHGISRTLTGLLTAGDTLSVAFWVRLDDRTEANITSEVVLTLKLDDSGLAAQYIPLARVIANETDWTLLSANIGLTWPTPPSSARVYAEGPAAGVDILVDDASVRVLTAP